MKNVPINWKENINLALQNVPTSGIRSFFDIIQSRPECISLGVGEPDFISPAPVIEKTISKLQQGCTHYTTNQGLLSLREEIAHYLIQEYNLHYNPSTEILITTGVSQGIDLTLRSILGSSSHKEKIYFFSPAYVSYSPLITISGGIPQRISLSAHNYFQIEPSKLDECLDHDAKALILNYPSNPTGTSISQEQLQDIAKITIEHNLLVISDEIYGEISYEYNHKPIACLPGMQERTLLLGGFSKAFAMTGFRIGYVCGPEIWVQALLKIHQYSMLCAPTLSQYAAEQALKVGVPYKDNMLIQYKERRDIIIQEFQDMAIPCGVPNGSFYVFPDIRCCGLSSLEFAKNLLTEYDVAVVPGSVFGTEGEGHIRCSYAISKAELTEALKRIKIFVQKYRIR